MRQQIKTIYLYDELPDERAKEKAREWYSRLVFEDSCDWEYVYDDAVRMAKLMGIKIDHSPVPLVGGSTRLKPDIMFSGFWSQGDGACFEGSYSYKKGAVEAIKKETGGCDEELIRIAKALQDVQRKHFYKLRARCTHRGHYYHSGCMDVEVYHIDDEYRDIGDAEEDVRQLMRDFADWIYERLEAEHDYQTSDEAVEESIRVNAYEFDENGERV